MDDYGPETYGKFWAPYYDDIFADVDHSVIELISGLAGTPPRMLELAIGSGRVAIPLLEKGVEVTGIDASAEMVAKLREKAGGESIGVTMGDFADVDIEETFPLVFLGFNTLFALPTQERQIDCFRNVADRLEPGGRFILDTFYPDVRRWDDENTRIGISAIDSTIEHSYEMSIHYPVEQRVDSHMVRRLKSSETVVLPVRVRYAWPSEMDLMARLAGLELENRWGWYDRRPFTEASGQHVSVYRKP